MKNLSLSSRVAFCQHCSETKQEKGTKFLLFHGNAKAYTVHTLHSVPVKGFTPHVIEYLGLADHDTAKVRKVCGICGVDLKYDKSIEKYHIYIKHESIILMPLKSYNGLILFTNTGYEVKEL